MDNFTIKNINTNEQYYQIVLDDYAVPSFVSSVKDYFGTLSDIEDFIGALNDDKDEQIYKRLSSALKKFRNGELTENERELIMPFTLLATVSYIMPSTKWEHLNVWDCTYKMQFRRAEIHQLWFEIDGKYVRTMKAKMDSLEYGKSDGCWGNIGALWGFPHIIENEGKWLYNRLAVVDKRFDNKTEAEYDYKQFLLRQDTNFSGFCDDIFGDG